MRFLRISPAILFFLLATFSCTDNAQYLPGYSGNSGEVLIIMETHQWNSSPGTIIKSLLSKAQYGLPQDEPVFDLVQVAPRDFEKIFQTHRNIITVDLKGKTDSVFTETKMDSWAKGQILISIVAPDEKSFMDFMDKYSHNIIDRINNMEIERQIGKNKGQGSVFQKKSGQAAFTITLQKDAAIAQEDSNFIWIRLERGRNIGGYEHQISQGVFVYWQPYSDTALFAAERIISDNDSVSSKHIKGKKENSFMVTSFKADPPQARRTKLKNQYAVEIRGLWRMENDFMGGPFISLTIINEKNNMVFTAEGYVFAPQFDKLLYLREVEAMIKSISFNDY